jgi:hypothetical protein
LVTTLQSLDVSTAYDHSRDAPGLWQVHGGAWCQLRQAQEHLQVLQASNNTQAVM